jgi:hypothetical protein
MAQQQLEKKIFQCFTCKQNVHLTRNETNTSWIKTNLDGTEHKHEKKEYKSNNYNGKPSKTLEAIESLGKTVNEMRVELAELRKEVRELKQVK